MLDGEGIVLNISSNVICDIVDKYLVDCETLNLPNVINALLRAVCEVNQKITAVEADLTTLNANYTIGCLTGVTASSDTHDILQATITKLCSVDAALTALALNVSVNYVNVANINSYIADYIASVGTNTNYYNRMVPYTVVEYYGSLTGFDVTGKGTGLWDKIYLCNGNNGTPDKRGRVPVGATTGMGGGAMNSAVDPAVAGNPAYALLGTAGANTITLSTNQIPSHSHTATAVSAVVDPGHTHTWPYTPKNESGGSGGFGVGGGATQLTSSSTTGISVTTNVTINPTGDGLAHNNYQPALGCYYIMYIP
jgi:microcystin-dependent protein